ncbi:MAG: rod shape-determining protein MreD [Bacillota bacterium]
MRVKLIAYTVLIFIMALLQSTVLDNMKIYNVKPNLLMVLIVCVALLSNNIEGAVIGFFCGLVQDMASGKVIGFYALLGLYLGLGIGSLNKRLYKENVLVVVFFSFISTIVYEYVVYLLNSFVKGGIDYLFPLRYVILPEAVYNSVVSIFIFIIVIKINHRSEESGKLMRRY